MAPISDFSIESILADENNVTNDVQPSEDSEKRPEMTYSALIFMAIRSSPRKLMTLNEICSWIETNFSFYQKNKASWQNSVRHTLSVNENFVKVPRPMDDPGRGCYWMLHPQTEAMTVGESTGRLRNADQAISSNGHPYPHPLAYWYNPQQLYNPATQSWHYPTLEELQRTLYYNGQQGMGP